VGLTERREEALGYAEARVRGYSGKGTARSQLELSTHGSPSAEWYELSADAFAELRM